MFVHLDKKEKELWLPQLFALLHENMQSIAPSGLTYEEEQAQWLTAVSPALEKAPRQILLCFAGGRLAGFMQYYIRQHLLMVEELQIKKEFQRTFLFCRLCKHLLSVLPGDLQTVEAFADKRNTNSIRLMKRLGMEPCPQEPDSPFIHMRGQAGSMYCFFKNTRAKNTQ